METEIIAMINNAVVEEIPEKGKGYIVDKVVCDNGVEASWDKNTWSLANIKNPNKLIKKVCQVNFVPIPDKTYRISANCNNEAAETYLRVQSVRQTIDTSDYSVLKVSTSYNHWVIYNAESTYRASISPVGYSTSWATNRGGIAGTIPNSTKTYDISNINSIVVSATSGSYGLTTVNITLTN